MPGSPNRLPYLLGHVIRRHSVAVLFAIGGLALFWKGTTTWGSGDTRVAPAAVTPATAESGRASEAPTAAQSVTPTEPMHPVPASWFTAVSEIVRNPQAEHPTETKVDQRNHAVSYAFHVAGLSRVFVTVYDQRPTRWDIVIGGPHLDIDTIGFGSARILCRHASLPIETIWYRFGAGPFLGAYAVPQATEGTDPTFLVTSPDEMRAEMDRERATGLAPPASSVDDYIRTSCH
jgi:hypothetical protein